MSDVAKLEGRNWRGYKAKLYIDKLLHSNQKSTPQTVFYKLHHSQSKNQQGPTLEGEDNGQG